MRRAALLALALLTLAAGCSDRTQRRFTTRDEPRAGYTLQAYDRTQAFGPRHEDLHLVPDGGNQDDKTLVASIAGPRGSSLLSAGRVGDRTVSICLRGEVESKEREMRFDAHHGGARFELRYECPAQGDTRWNLRN
ncbi:MAG: hypothetical protein JSR45_05015 [Proteobacteria bacterium]|nr:hypothetical protein [Pseudomonadota bacterium]